MAGQEGCAGGWSAQAATGRCPEPAAWCCSTYARFLETDDGAIIYVTYRGRCDRVRGTYTVAPTFQTADERYTWLNVVQAVGRGRVAAGRLDYEMFEVR